MVSIYTQSSCNYCTLAKEWLDFNDINYCEFNLDHDQIKNEFKRNYPHLSTVPQIFLNGKHIGGYYDLLVSGIENGLHE